ncbi:MAG: Crp/Fnr family transcriptional regulator [Clostridia bacterium]|nr:Crp/Fnr family transcriptional regulator [Clostridia bacterium]
MKFDINTFNRVTNCYLNRDLPSECILDIVKTGKEKNFKKGELILGIGERMNKVYFILDGIARSYYIDNDGNDVTKSFLCEYNFCVSESFFVNDISCQSFEAIENMTVLEYDAENLKSIIMSIPELKDAYIQMLEQTIVYKMNRESSFQLESAAERYINFKKIMPNIENRVKQSYIASYLGITSVSLSRIRRALREDLQ